MRKIGKPNISPSDWRIVKGNELAEKLKEEFERGVRNLKVTNHYVKFKDVLERSHMKKCCYCEASLDRQHGDIEHFRPKQMVTDENHKKQKAQIGTESIDHPGYFWLAYDINNLLLSCAICNQPSKSKDSSCKCCSGPNGKWNRFPLANPEQRGRPFDYEVKDEDLLLIDPLDEEINIADHLELASDGRLRAKTAKGETTICVFDLNSANLIKWRWEAKREGFEILHRLLENWIKNDEVQVQADKEKIRQIIDEEVEFSMAYWLGFSTALINLRKGGPSDWLDAWLNSIVADAEAAAAKDG